MRVFSVVLLAIVAACGFRAGTLAGDGGSDGAAIDAPRAWYADLEHRKRITITPGGSFDDFTAGIVIRADSQIAAAARADARDFVFTAADGTTLLAFELEAYTPGNLDAWVRLPKAGPSTDIYLYYGGGTLDLQDRANTWSANYLGVWHAADAGNQAMRDSTAKMHDLTGANLPATDTGIAGTARTFDGTNDSITVADDNMLDMGTRSFSYSMWLFVTRSRGLYDIVLYKGGGIANDTGYDFELGTDGWIAYLDDGFDEARAVLGSDTSFFNQWRYVTIVIDRALQEMRCYVNATLLRTVPITAIGSIDNSRPLTFSRPGFLFPGRLDEVRIYNSALIDAWIAAEYNNLAMPSTFLAVHPEESR